jgi:transmembrane sensor
MNDERFYELTEKFLARDISEEEKNELSIILLIDKYKSQFESIASGWNDSSRDNADFDDDRAFSTLTKKLNAADKSFLWSDLVNTNKKRLFKSPLLKIAASIAFLAVLAAAYFYLNNSRKEIPVEQNWQELNTAAGERYELILPDKSKIVVNGCSRVTYPLRFRDNKREVYINGEAYFEISKDSSKPFLVHADNITTKVLGTKFNVSTFTDKNIEVALVEGSVKIINEAAGVNNEAILLKPMQIMRYDAANNLSSIEVFDMQETIGWKDNILKFTNTALKEVLVKLERAFGIKFELADKSYNSLKITGNFQKATYAVICESLKKLTNLQYKIVKENNEVKKIIFYYKNK